MNELIIELEVKANCMLKECPDQELQDAAFYMLQAAMCLKSYEARKGKEEYGNRNS